MDNVKLRRRIGLLTLGLLFQAAYILFPVDLLPDFIPFVGWIDDMLAMAGMASTAVILAKTLKDGGAEALLELMPQGQVPVVDPADYEPIPAEVLREL